MVPKLGVSGKIQGLKVGMNFPSLSTDRPWGNNVSPSVGSAKVFSFLAFMDARCPSWHFYNNRLALKTAFRALWWVLGYPGHPAAMGPSYVNYSTVLYVILLPCIVQSSTETCVF